MPAAGQPNQRLLKKAHGKTLAFYQEELPKRCSFCELPGETERIWCQLKYLLVIFFVFKYFLECLHRVSDISVSADSGVSETVPISRQTITICLFVNTQINRYAAALLPLSQLYYVFVLQSVFCCCCIVVGVANLFL